MLTVLVLLVLSALVSGSEVAFFNLSPQALHDLEQDSPRAQNVLTLMRSPNNVDGPRNLLGTILVINNLVNVSIVLIATVLAEQLFGERRHASLAGHADPRGGRHVPVGAVWGGHSQDLRHVVWVDLAKLMAAPLLLSRPRPIWKPLVGMGRWMTTSSPTPRRTSAWKTLSRLWN